MLDIKFVKENPELVKENIRRKFEDNKLPLVNEAIATYDEKIACNIKASDLRAKRNKLSKQIGVLMGQGKRDEAEELKAEVSREAEELKALEEKEAELGERLQQAMMKIPNIIDPIQRTSRFSSSASRLTPISRCLTTPTSWQSSTASTRRPQAAFRARASTT